MVFGLFKKQPPKPDPVAAYAKINMRLSPEQRGRLFEERWRGSWSGAGWGG